jgi:hypothetical protein
MRTSPNFRLKSARWVGVLAVGTAFSLRFGCLMGVLAFRPFLCGFEAMCVGPVAAGLGFCLQK